jgi:hypothetical protein
MRSRPPNIPDPSKPESNAVAAAPAPDVAAQSSGVPLLFPIGHFYSPIANPAEVYAREGAIWQRRDTMPGIDMNVEAQRALLRQLAPYTADIAYPVEPTLDPSVYHYNNDQFPCLDAEFLYAALCHFKPKRMIEVGSGFSSLITADVNRRILGNQLEFTCIEPYPRRFLIDGVGGITRLLCKKVQDVDLALYDSLEAGDILFIDSSHVSKVGSDVNHLFFEVLPRLKPGVMVHVHDISLPDEYPRVWVYQGRNWNEQYLLRAFLQHNSEWEIVWMASFMATRYAEEVQQVFPRFPRLGAGGSFWLRKVR